MYYSGRYLFSLLGYCVFLAVMPRLGYAHGALSDQVLKGFQVPSSPGLIGKSRIVIDQQAAIQLGKALFWDANVGSDGMACASCHFHAGSDFRIVNQLNPGKLNIDENTSKVFNLPSGNSAGPNYRLRVDDFPFFRFSDVNNIQTLINSTDDVVGSAGIARQRFEQTDGQNGDQCESELSDIYHIGNLNARQVTSRNAPTVINAAFNFRNFWDGRANNVFNGQSAYGLRDKDAKIWIAKSKTKVGTAKLMLENASLASLAVAPPLDMIEMSCSGRGFSDIGRKLLSRRPLEYQNIHPEDSVLANLRDSSGKGLATTYSQLIQKAFNKKYWMSNARIQINGSAQSYSQMEANFAMFFGLAIQLYESTLISDNAPFDQAVDDETGFPASFTEEQKRGFVIFNDAHCNTCHSGPTFSSAASPQIYMNPNKKPRYLRLVDRDVLGEQSDGFGVDSSLQDIGFAVTSVTPTSYDLGLGGNDPFGNPLSFSRQYINVLSKRAAKMLDPVTVAACEMVDPFVEDYFPGELVKDSFAKGIYRGSAICRGSAIRQAKVPLPSVVLSELAKAGQGRLSDGVNAAFKIPTLRNVELTGPYMHNGGMKSLEEVVEFYNRGGNLTNPRHSTTLVFAQHMSDRQKSDLVAFLKTLTDERVRWEKAPFDHPELSVPNGHTGDEHERNVGVAADDFLHIPAVGKNGRSQQMGPLKSFDGYLQD